MSIGDIIGDALVYPFNNIKALILYIILGMIAAFIGGASLIGLVSAAASTGLNGYTFGGLSTLGVLIFILVLFLIEGYALDIIKFGIERRDDAPGIDIVRQISNALKLIVVDFVYYIVPAVIIFILGLFLRDWILTIISLILVIIFALANFMAKCKLAQTDDLGAALSIGEAIGDIVRVGIGKILATVILIVIILVIIAVIIAFIARINNTIGSILLGIFVAYFIFFYNRAIGLMYSDAY